MDLTGSIWTSHGFALTHKSLAVMAMEYTSRLLNSMEKEKVVATDTRELR